MFPTLLKSAPKSGGWMNVLKVTLGFVELAFALKFLSVADLAYGWHILDRETFLALWIALFSLLGLYLLGLFNFPHDDEAGMAAARLEGKPVMVDFTGFGCVNCRKMEAAVWTDAKVADLLNQKYVLISLFVDDKTPLPEQMEVTDTDGTKRTLRTVGDKWSYLQRYKFGSNTQPMYILVDNEGMPLTGSRSYDENISEYMDFLNAGLEAYAKR